MPVVNHLLKLAVAHAGGFLERSLYGQMLSLAVAAQPWPLFTLSGHASTCAPLALVFRSAILMDKASRVLANGLPSAVPTSYRALADHGEVPRSTLHARAQGRRSIEEKAQSQQYLSPWEEDALVKFLLQMSDLGQPVRIKFIPFLAFCVARDPSKPDHRSHRTRTGRAPSRNAIQTRKHEGSQH
jgi:hypothetical protein